MTPDDTQQGILANRQEKAPRKTLSRPAAQGQAEMMHDTLEPRGTASKRTRSRGRKPFRENPLAAGRQDTAKPTRPEHDPHSPTL
jgi:hypothetical protein